MGRVCDEKVTGGGKKQEIGWLEARLLYIVYTTGSVSGLHTMNTLLTDTEIKNRREEILEEIRGIRHLKRGAISTTMERRPDGDGTIKEYGPYYLFQRWSEGKNRPRRVCGEELAELQRAVAGYKRYNELTEEYAKLTEILTERSGALLPAKKNSRSWRAKRSSRKRKLPSRSPAGG